MANLLRNFSQKQNIAFLRKYWYSCAKCYSSNNTVPPLPTWSSVDEEKLCKAKDIDEMMIKHLERLALVDFGNQEGIDRLTKAVRFADQMDLVNTDHVKPMTSVLEDYSLHLRPDKVTDGHVRDDLMRLAKKTVEEYYVSPPGNIPHLSEATSETLDKQNTDKSTKDRFIEHQKLK